MLRPLFPNMVVGRQKFREDTIQPSAIIIPTLCRRGAGESWLSHFPSAQWTPRIETHVMHGQLLCLLLLQRAVLQGASSLQVLPGQRWVLFTMNYSEQAGKPCGELRRTSSLPRHMITNHHCNFCCSSPCPVHTAIQTQRLSQIMAFLRRLLFHKEFCSMVQSHTTIPKGPFLASLIFTEDRQSPSVRARGCLL